jgi:drug/metabolite transporter (DMT)-like permease
MKHSNPSHTKAYFLLVAIVFIWGFLWPINKIGLEFMPALWFVWLRLIIATGCMFLLVTLLGKLSLPKKQDWPMILVVSFFQTGLFLGLLTSGLEYLSAGRSAILVYSTPIWVTPIAYFFFHEYVSKRKILGVLFGCAGILLLFSPWGLDWHQKHAVIGNILMLLSAWSWAFAMLFTRFRPWHSSVLAITPWQLLVATVLISFFTFIFEPHPHIIWSTSSIATIVYASVIGTAFAYWGIVQASKELPVTTTSLAMLAVPVIGVLTSALILKEPITLLMLSAMLLILIGLTLAALGNRLPSKIIKPELAAKISPLAE